MVSPAPVARSHVVPRVVPHVVARVVPHVRGGARGVVTPPPVGTAEPPVAMATLTDAATPSSAQSSEAQLLILRVQAASLRVVDVSDVIAPTLTSTLMTSRRPQSVRHPLVETAWTGTKTKCIHVGYTASSRIFIFFKYFLYFY